MRLVCEAAPVVKSTGLASVTENNKRECTISQQESALFTFRTMETKTPFFLRELFALYLKAEKKKETKNPPKHGHATLRTGATKEEKKQTNYEEKWNKMRLMEELKELFC